MMICLYYAFIFLLLRVTQYVKGAKIAYTKLLTYVKRIYDNKGAKLAQDKPLLIIKVIH